MLFKERRTGKILEVKHDDVLPTDSDVANYTHYKKAGGHIDPNAIDDARHPNHQFAKADLVLQERAYAADTNRPSFY